MSRLNSFPERAFAVISCRLSIAVTGLHWLNCGDTLRFYVAVAALLLTAVPTLLVRDSRLNKVATVVISLLLAAHIVLGMQLELYETSKLYDKAMHVLGSAAVAGVLIVATRAYSDRYRIKIPLTLFALLVSAGVLSLGTLWELFEFGIDRTGLFRAQRGLHDTMFDLIADAIGAVIATSLFVATSWRQEQLRKRCPHKLIAMTEHSSICSPDKVGPMY